MPISFDEPQRRAVEHERGPMLVLAGAGTGKTTVLVERIARLLRQELAQPAEILAVSYTDNSAADLRRKVQKRLPNADCSALKASTFHAYCFGLLKANKRDFQVLDNSDLWVFLRRNLSELRLQSFIKAANPGEFLNDLLRFCDRCRDELVTASIYRAYVQRLHAGEMPLVRAGKSTEQLSPEEVLGRCDELARVYETVERLLAAKNLGTYGDMIVRAVEVLRTDARALERERAGARFILIDEFQDTNVAQIELAALLAGEAANIFAVGDPDQAIYRFRGASSGAFQEFLRRFPTSQRVTLERNHRSTTPILRAAFAAISRNSAIIPASGAALDFERQQLVSARDQASGRDHPRSPVEIVLASEPEAEAAEVAERVRELHDASESRWKDFAVLFRQNAHRRELVEEFSARSIPVSVSGVDVLEASPVRDLLAVLRCLHSSADVVSLLRVAALPKFGLPAEQVRIVLQQADSGEDAISRLLKFPGGHRLGDAISKCREVAIKRAAHVTVMLPLVLEKFGLDESGIAAPLQIFLSFVAAWEQKPITSTKGLAEFLEYLEYFHEAGGKVSPPAPEDEVDAVQLLSVHTAKGLEFSNVYVIRLNSNSFPVKYQEPLFAFPDALRHSPPPADENQRDLHTEEERRLFYVAMTRARESLVLCAKPGGKKDPSPAGFLRELMCAMKNDPALISRNARPYRVALAAGAQPAPSAVAPWLQLPPARNLRELPLSATAIEMYRTCPLQFKIHNDWRLPGEAPASMQFGNAMHSAMKFYFAQPGSSPSPQQLLARLKDDLARRPFDDVLQRELYAKLGVQQLSVFMESQALAPARNVLSTEKSFQVEIAGVAVIGRMDRIDHVDSPGSGAAPARVIITDYKTGRPRTQKDADASLQLSIYALAANRAWQLDPERLVFHNLENGVLVETTRNSVQLLEAEEIVAEVAAHIVDEKFEPTPGYHCRWCAYHSICPAQEQRLYTIGAGQQSLAAVSARVH